jgi:hypothetical protein
MTKEQNFTKELSMSMRFESNIASYRMSKETAVITGVQ